MSQLSLVDELSSPPLSSSSRSRDESRNVSRSQGDSSRGFPLDMMSQLSLVDELSSPPLSSSSRSRDESGDVARSQGDSSRGLPLSDMMSKLSLVDELSSPPLSSSRGLPLSPLSNGDMMHITVGEVGTRSSVRLRG